MAKSKRKKNNHKSLKIVGTIVCIGILVAYFFLFSSMSSSGKTEYIFIDHDDNIDSVYHKLKNIMQIFSKKKIYHKRASK